MSSIRIIHAIIGFLVCVSVSASADFTLVENGKPAASIVLTDTSALIRETAADFAGIIERMSGARLPVVAEASGPAVVIGPREVDAALHPQAYHVVLKGNRLYLSGATPRGASNAAYAFLGKTLGCRWYAPWPVGEYIPNRKTVSLSAIDMTDRPDFESVRGFGPHPDPKASRLWLRRNLMEGFPNQYHSHNWHNIISPKHRNAHPEWFALTSKGSRTDQLCTTNPEVIDSAVAATRRYFDTNPTSPMFSLSPNDGFGFCECDRCKALDRKLGADKITSETGTFTPRLVTFCNEVARELQKTHPGKSVAFYAYISHTDPPKNVTVHPNVIPVICHTPWDFCPHHAISDPKCARNKLFAENVRGWGRLARKFYLYDYYGHYGWYGPYGLVHTIRRDLPWLKSKGLAGFNSETHRNWWTQGPNLYVPIRLSWNLGDDVDLIVREYSEHLFGPGGPFMKQYFQMGEDLLANTPYDRDDERAFVADMTPEFFARGKALLDSADAAIAAADMPTDRRTMIIERMRKIRVGYEFGKAQGIIEQADVRSGSVEASPDYRAFDRVFGEMMADSTLHDVIALGLVDRFVSARVRKYTAFAGIWADTRFRGVERRDLRRLLSEGKLRDVARGLGFITEWKMIGLFPAPEGQELTFAHPPEREIGFDATYKGTTGDVRWKSVTAPGPFGIIDIQEMFHPTNTDKTVAYFYAEVDFLGDGRNPYFEFRLGTNDGGVLWVNGQRVLSSEVERSLLPDSDRVWARLKKGRNRILVKVYNAGNKFEFCLRMLDFRAYPFPGRKKTGK
jgi:hypothetical protein